MVIASNVFAMSASEHHTQSLVKVLKIQKTCDECLKKLCDQSVRICNNKHYVCGSCSRYSSTCRVCGNDEIQEAFIGDPEYKRQVERQAILTRGWKCPYGEWIDGKFWALE